MRKLLDPVLAVAAVVLLVWSLTALETATDGLAVERTQIGATPATIFRAAQGAPAPVVVIAHGFAGSEQLMHPFAVSLARAGYVAVTFDFLGHGRHPAPLTGDVTDENGATQSLLAQLGEVVAFARTLDGSDGRTALLGHSMASDIIVRYAQADDAVAATVAVAMFAPTVTATTPRNLLVVVGDWEPRLKEEALRVASMVADGTAVEGVTYGDHAAGTARRVVFADRVEHVGVLYSTESLEAARDWLNRVFEREAVAPVDARGPAIVMLLAGLVLLARPLARLLPQVAPVPLGAGLGWRALLVCALVPMVLTPLLLRLVPFQFLPVLVADYLIVHFALYGVLTALTLALTGAGKAPWPALRQGVASALPAALAVALYSVVVLGLPVDRHLASFVPTGDRVPYVLLMVAGTLPYFVADEWLTRGPGARPGAFALTKLCFVLSLGLATALDIERLFFLLLIMPVIALFFVIYGLFAGWAYRRTRHPLVGGIANAVAFAWAIAVTFPIVAG